MANNSKPTSDYDQTIIFQKAYNPQDNSITVGGFVNGRIGNKIVVAYPSSSTETYSYYQNTSELLLTILVTYTDSTKLSLSSVERTA